MRFQRISGSKILLFLSLIFVGGVFVESVIDFPQAILWIFLFSAVVLLFAPRLPKFFGFLILFFVLGVLRMQIAEYNIANNNLSKLNGEEVELSGTIVGEPDLRESSQKLKIKTEKGNVLATAGRYPEYEYLDRVKISGKLEEPFETEDFSYKNYLMKDGIYSVMAFPKIEKIGKAPAGLASAIFGQILRIKQKLRQAIAKIYPSPDSLIMQGMILGDKTAIPSDIKNKFSITGVSHIIAVSGSHIVILTNILLPLLLAFGLWRKQAVYSSIALICFYIVLVGLPASGIRAGIMGVLYLLAENFGRQGTASRTIVLAAAFMLMQNPLLLFYDIGFQLSFLAVLGLINFEPMARMFLKSLIKKIFKKDLGEKHDSVFMIFSATISAQVFTLPVLVYNFGNISFISAIANILILPVVPYIMIFGFLSAAAGIFWDWFGWVFSLPCYFLLNYFMAVVNFFSKPWAYRTIENVHWAWLLASYVFIAVATRFLNKKITARF